MSNQHLVDEALKAYPQWYQERAMQFGACDQSNWMTYGETAIGVRHGVTIGGTAAAAIVGYNPYQSPYDVYQSLTAIREPFKGNYLTRRGLALESLIAERAAEILKLDLLQPIRTSYDLQTGVNRVEFEFTNSNSDHDSESYVAPLQSLTDHFQYGFATAQIDSLLFDPDNGYTICECKTANHNPTAPDGEKVWGMGSNINAHGVFLEVDDRIPRYYLVQVQWQLLMLTKAKERLERAGAEVDPHTYNTKWAFVACDISGNNDIRIYKIDADEVMQQQLLEECAFFLLEHVFKGVPPSTGTLMTTKCEIVDEKAATANAEFERNYEQYNEAKAEIKKLTEVADKAKALMLEALSDGVDVVVDSDGHCLLKRTQYARNSFDSKALGNEYPDIYKRFMKKEQSTRVTIY